MEVSITRASRENREAVLKLSSLFTKDYLTYTVDLWIAQEKGGLYLAWDRDLLVGCCSLFFPSAIESWLQGMRVHPDYQGRGIAYHLNKHLIEQAKTEGAAAVRLLTSENNHPALKVAHRLGFSPTGGRRKIIFRATISTENLDHVTGPTQVSIPRPCKTSELNRAAYFLEAGPLFHELQGYYFGPRYYYRRLTEAELEKGIYTRQVYLFEEQEETSGLLYILHEKAEDHLILSYLDAPLGQLPSLLPLFKAWSAEGYQKFTINLLAEQHRVLKPALEKLFGAYEYEQWLLMEKNLVP